MKFRHTPHALEVLIFTFVFATGTLYGVNPLDSVKYFNWFNLDPELDKVPGIGTERVYAEKLGNRLQHPVTVAVIDAGVDTRHEDLTGKIWQNSNEIPGDGIDNDKNGFIDDISGWNFLGGASGQNIDYENYEVTRVYRAYKQPFGERKKRQVTKGEKALFDLFRKSRDTHYKKYNEALREYRYVNFLVQRHHLADSIARFYNGLKDYTLEDLLKIDTGENQEDKKAIQALISFYSNGFTDDLLNKYQRYVEDKINFHFNLSYTPRYIAGDNPEDITDMQYGNSDVSGDDPSHGTFVAGIIAACRYNNLGIKGIADSARIMVIRAVPNGDERDKDVALAIRYAVDKGARVINMSFGKDISPQKEMVDNALRYAAQHDVLLVHAAGNEGINIDREPRFPLNRDSQNLSIHPNWISVGASSAEVGPSLAGSFSNWGKSVDLFAPGVQIYSLDTGNNYDIQDGTSAAAPMVSGAAALLFSWFPTLTAAEVKDILLQTVTPLGEEKVRLPTEKQRKKPKLVKFSSLSATGGVLNLYRAVELAEKVTSEK